MLAVFADPTLVDLFKGHDGLMSLKWDGYLMAYDIELAPYRNRKHGIRLLEIGVMNGGGLVIWKKYFGRLSEIVGIDINPEVCQLNLDAGIRTYCFDATSSYGDVQGGFDIIIDDASHRSSDVILAFLQWFRKVSQGGMYVVEDLEHSYYAESGGGLLKEGSSMDFFQKMSNILNFYSIRSQDQSLFDSIYVNIYGANNILYLIDWIKSIKFIDQIVFIEKRTTTRRAFNLVFSGRLMPVVYFGHTEQFYKNTEEL